MNKTIIYKNKINYKLYKHINDTWYYNNKSLCIPYVSDKMKILMIRNVIGQ